MLDGVGRALHISGKTCVDVVGVVGANVRENIYVLLKASGLVLTTISGAFVVNACATRISHGDPSSYSLKTLTDRAIPIVVLPFNAAATALELDPNLLAATTFIAGHCLLSLAALTKPDRPNAQIKPDNQSPAEMTEILELLMRINTQRSIGNTDLQSAINLTRLLRNYTNDILVLLKEISALEGNIYAAQGISAIQQFSQFLIAQKDNPNLALDNAANLREQFEQWQKGSPTRVSSQAC